MLDATTLTFAFVFPGMGVKTTGHEAHFYHRHERVLRPFLEQASGAAGTNLIRALINGGVTELPDPVNQLFTYGYSAGVAQVMRQAGIEPSFVSGYSMGIYAALQTAGAVNFADGLGFLTTAHRLMSEACAGTRYGMGAVIGLRTDEMRLLLRASGVPSVLIANNNSDTCQIISGESGEVGTVLEAALRDSAIKTETFAVEIPYHHPVLTTASDKLRPALSAAHWLAPECPVISTVDQMPVRDIAGLQDLLCANLSTPIHWQNTIQTLHGLGCTTFVECGPGTTLTRNAQFLDVELDFVNLRGLYRRFGV